MLAIGLFAQHVRAVEVVPPGQAFHPSLKRWQ